MLEHSWALYMDPLMVLMMGILQGDFLEVHWDILMVKFLDLMKASNWDILMVKFLELYLEV